MTKPPPGRSPRTSHEAPRGEADLRARAEREAYRQRLDAFFASHEVAGSLTSDSLSAGITLRVIVDAAASVADFADEALAIVNDEYRPALQCRESCCYCCCKPGVLVTIPELLRILSTIESRFDDTAKVAVADRARRYASQIEGHDFNASTDDSVPCPLLVEGRCSVYDVRPLVCRGYNSTSVNACRSAYEDARQQIPIFSVLKDVTDGAAVGVSHSLRAAGVNDAMADLGSALNLALASGDAFARAVLEGGIDLTTIQNSNWVADLWARVQATAKELEGNRR